MTPPLHLAFDGGTLVLSGDADILRRLPNVQFDPRDAIVQLQARFPPQSRRLRGKLAN
jgi:hypothetical protein